MTELFSKPYSFSEIQTHLHLVNRHTNSINETTVRIIYSTGAAATRGLPSGRTRTRYLYVQTPPPYQLDYRWVAVQCMNQEYQVQGIGDIRTYNVRHRLWPGKNRRVSVTASSDKDNTRHGKYTCVLSGKRPKMDIGPYQSVQTTVRRGSS